jgi:hypothetical protein
MLHLSVQNALTHNSKPQSGSLLLLQHSYIYCRHGATSVACRDAAAVGLSSKYHQQVIVYYVVHAVHANMHCLFQTGSTVHELHAGHGAVVYTMSCGPVSFGHLLEHVKATYKLLPATT